MEFPFEWQPRIVSTQLAFIGSVAIACVPGEFTTMAGRRLRDAVTDNVARLGGPSISEVIVAGLCNTYSDYVTTPEEYEVGNGSVRHYCRTVCTRVMPGQAGSVQ
jgi:neutral ceramidase